MNMLLRLHKRRLIEFAPRTPDVTGRGRLYRITRTGLEWLQHCTSHREQIQEMLHPVIETGAMRGERATVVIRDAANASCSPCAQPYWVFGLGEHQQGLNTP